MTALLAQSSDAPARPSPVRSAAVWWAVPPLAIVLLVWPLIGKMKEMARAREKRLTVQEAR